MEMSLHRQLKDRFGKAVGGRLEVRSQGFRADAIDADGSWIEVQSGPLGPLRSKLERLLASHQIRVIKPVVLERRIVRRQNPKGPDLSTRRSPRRGRWIDVFNDLIGLARCLAHPNLRLEILGVTIDEVRVASHRRPGFVVVDRLLRSVEAIRLIAEPADLWTLLPTEVPEPFSTSDVAALADVPIVLAQRVAYCLRLSGAARTCGKQGNRILYTRSTNLDVPGGVQDAMGSPGLVTANRP